MAGGDGGQYFQGAIDDVRIYNVALSDSAAIEDTISGKKDLRLKVARNALAAAFLGQVALGMIDQNLAHGRAGHREEMTSVGKRRVFDARQPQIGFMHKSCGLQRVAGTFSAKVLVS